MDKKIIMALFPVVFIILASSVKSEYLNETGIKSMEIFFDIQADYKLKQTTKISFKDQIKEPVNLSVASKVSKVEILDQGFQKLEYTLFQDKGNYIIQIIPKKPTNMLLLRYSTDGNIFKSKSESHFFTEISHEKIPGLKVQVRLPQGYGLYRNSFLPENARISSDGKQILLLWDKVNSSAIISVKFTKLDQKGNVWLFISFFSFAMLSTSLVFSFFHFKRKSKEAFLKGFRNDEQKTIKFLELNKISFQNKLQTEFQFSRAKATRIIMKLEEKGLVKKERCGRTNKVFWIAKQ